MADLKLTPVVPAGSSTAVPFSAPGKVSSGFGQVLTKAINAVNQNMQEAETMAAGLITGQHANIHETMIAEEKAGISFRMLTKTQNKVIEAYQEIMRMQL